MAHDPFKASEALRRASDILKEGSSYTDKSTALRTLHEPLAGRRRVTHWHAVMEKIITLHLELCIDLGKLDFARKALEQYKKITQNGNAASLNEVITAFVTKLDQKLNSGIAGQTAKESEQLSLEEGLRAAGFANDEFREMLDRRKQLPQAKFTWEAHRFSLEILRVNPKLSSLFLNTIQRSALFCYEYKRKGDLKDLLKLTKKHLERIPKIASKEADMRKFYYSTPDLYYCYLDTWFKIFDVASSPQMGMWQEAYRTVEQVHVTMYEAFFGLAPKPAHMITYFEALAKVFWAATVGPHQLYHAYALFNLWRRKKKLGTVDAALSGQVVLACLCIPFSDSTSTDAGGVADRSVENPFALLTQWTQLLGLRYTPSRAYLLRDIANVIPLCDPVVQNLYAIVNRSVYSLNFLHETLDDLASIAKSEVHAAYVPLIRKNIVTAVVCTAFRSYSYVTMPTLVSLCKEESFSALEGIVLQVAALRKESVYIDQEKGTVRFSRRDGDTFSATLSNVRNIVAQIQSDYVVRRDKATQDELVKAAIEGAAAERQQLMVRLELMEKRRVAQDVDKEERRKDEFQKKQAKDTHDRQVAAQQLEQERVAREAKKKADDEKLKDLARGVDLVKKLEETVGKKMDDLRKIEDKAALIAAAQSRLQQEQKTLEDKAKEEVKRLDFFVRAMREQEAPALAQWWESASTEMQKDAEVRQQNQLEMHRKNFEAALENKKRMQVMNDKRLAFQNRLIEQRKLAFQEQTKKRNQEQRVAEQLAAGAAKSNETPSLRDQPMREQPSLRDQPLREQPGAPPSPAAPPPPEPTPAPAGEGAGTGKWQSKPRGAPRPPPPEDAPAPIPPSEQPPAEAPPAEGDAPKQQGKWVPKSKGPARPPPSEDSPSAAPPPAAPTAPAETAPPAAAPAPSAGGAWKPKSKR